MVLYHAANMCCYVKCIVHKMLYHHDEDAVFIGYDWLALENKNAVNIFSQSHFYKPFFGFAGCKNELNCSEYEIAILEYFDQVLSEWGLDLSQFDEIHLGSYYADFIVYVNMKGAAHFFHEEGAGGLIDGTSQETEMKQYPAAYHVKNKYGIYSFSSKNIIKKYGVLNSIKPEFRTDDMVNFEVYNEVLNLCDSDKDLLINCFSIPTNIDFLGKNVLLLTKWYMHNGDKWKSLDIILLYQILLDYYLDSKISEYNLIIKPHPADPFRLVYKNYFEKAVIIDQLFPSELLGIMPNINFEYAITDNSSSLDTILKFTKETIKTEFGFDSLYRVMHRIFVSYKILSELITDNTKCYHYGIFNEQVDSIINNIVSCHIESSWADINRFDENSITIVDRLIWGQHTTSAMSIQSLFNGSLNAVIIFLNSDNSYPFYSSKHIELLKYIVPVTIKKTAIKENVLCDLQNETIYVFCKNPEIREKVRNFSFSKTLKYTGIELSVSPITEHEVEMKNMLMQIDIGQLQIEKQNVKIKDLDKKVDELIQKLRNV